MDRTHLLPKRPHSTALQTAENVRNHHAIRVDAEHTLDDALHPNYLWPFHEKIQKGDLIEFSHELGLFWALFYAMDIDPETASIVLVPLFGPVDLKAAPVRKADLSRAQTKLRGQLRWCVEAGDGTILVKNLPTRADAENWLDTRRASPRIADIKAGQLPGPAANMPAAA